MYINPNNDVISDFCLRTISLQGETISISHDHDMATYIVEIEAMVLKIISSKPVLFHCDESTDRNGCSVKHFKCKKPSIFNFIKPFVRYHHPSYENRRELKSALALRIAESFPMHRFNPYVDLFIKNVNAILVGHIDADYLRYYHDCYLPDHNKNVLKAVDAFNQCIASIRTGVADPAFQQTLKNYTRQVRQNHRSLARYIANLFNRYGRLLVLRVDLSYAKKDGDEFMTDQRLAARLDQVVADRERFINNMRSNKLFTHKVGLVWKLEYGLEKGYHYHMFFFYDGSQVREDITLARMIGEYWRDSVTDGRGLYFNCNAKKAGYKYRGIGMINHYEHELIANLITRAATYLTKTDYYAMLEAKAQNIRTFGKGIVQPKTDQRGRRRTRVSDSHDGAA